MDRYPFPRSDNFQQVIYTSAGTIDVIATDQVARQHNAHIVAKGLAIGLAALRNGVARLLHATANRLDGAGGHERLAHPAA
ncbi:hypothetical protein [Terrarubrum flagellatum]|uniref:hypothetical protein n=1 Tax=Terrirubrum flagellatum TaxID=2895980 RepID=UPI003144D441